jgi:hypothetical protein
MDSCVERVYISQADSVFPLVVDGGITNEPGPYHIKLSRASKVGGDLTQDKTVFAQQVAIFDDQGNSEILSVDENGTYSTSTFQGVVGRQYFIRINTRDGKTYESVPEIMKPAGTVDSVYFEFVSSHDQSGAETYGFNIFSNFSGYPQGNNLFRWKFAGTYRVETHPELQTEPAGEGRIPDPPPCSGWVYASHTLSKVGPCECCICWASLTEQLPEISDSQVSVNGQFKNIQVGFVPVEYWTFFDKIMVSVRQLSLSQSEYDYWRIVRQQLEGGGSLFQPAIGKARSNLFMKNGSEEVYGYFTVAAVSKKVIFIQTSDLPSPDIIPPAPPTIDKSCIDAFKNSTNQQPADWK